VAGKNGQLQAANERLILLQRQLTTLEKLATLGQISTLIAHELGTPLNAISGHLQLLLQDPVSDSRVHERLKVIDGQVDRLTGIVRDVLKVMRVPPPRYERIDVRRVIQDVAELFGPLAEKRKIFLNLKLEDDVPEIGADPGQLQQVFLNLITNAVDAMKGGARSRSPLRLFRKRGTPEASCGLTSRTRAQGWARRRCVTPSSRFTQRSGRRRTPASAWGWVCRSAARS